MEGRGGSGHDRWLAAGGCWCGWRHAAPPLSSFTRHHREGPPAPPCNSRGAAAVTEVLPSVAELAMRKWLVWMLPRVTLSSHNNGRHLRRCYLPLYEPPGITLPRSSSCILFSLSVGGKHCFCCFLYSLSEARGVEGVMKMRVSRMKLIEIYRV